MSLDKLGMVSLSNHIIDTDEHYTAYVRYIYRNPVRAGIVSDLQEYEDSSFIYYAFGKEIDVLLAHDHLVMRYGSKKKEIYRNFRTLVMADGEPFVDDEVMKNSLRKPFFGSSGFIQQMYQIHFPV